METEKMIFWRDFLFKTFIVGIVFLAIIVVVYVIFSNSAMMPWGASLFKVEEHDLGRLTLYFLGAARFVLVFLVLVPCIALHWMIKQKKQIQGDK